MSDRIAVMSRGLVQQVGGPNEIYETPVNRFVADFIGRSNFLEGSVASSSGKGFSVALTGGAVLQLHSSESYAPGDKVTLVVRPEKIALQAGQNGGLNGIVSETMYLGTDTSYSVALANGAVLEVRDQNGLTGVPPGLSAATRFF